MPQMLKRCLVIYIEPINGVRGGCFKPKASS